MDEIFDLIRNAFHSLWKVKHYGKTIEIVTPSFTTNDCFVSIFLTERDGKYIVTDNGWVNDNYYNSQFDNDDEAYLKLFSYFKDKYAIKELEAKNKIYYYKYTNNKELVANIVMELSIFISTVVSSSFIEFQENKDKELRHRFRTSVNAFLTDNFEKDEIKLGTYVSDNYKDIKFNAVLKKDDRLTLYNYVTGTTDFYFRGSLGRSNMNFQLINKTPLKRKIHRKVTVINNSASGYNLDRLRQYLELIPEQTGSEIVNWSDKDLLLKV